MYKFLLDVVTLIQGNKCSEREEDGRMNLVQVAIELETQSLGVQKIKRLISHSSMLW